MQWEYGRALTVDSIRSDLRHCIQPCACKPTHSTYLYTWHWGLEGLKPLESAAAHIMTDTTSGEQFCLCATGDVSRSALCHCGVAANFGPGGRRFRCAQHRIEGSLQYASRSDISVAEANTFHFTFHISLFSIAHLVMAAQRTCEKKAYNL